LFQSALRSSNIDLPKYLVNIFSANNLTSVMVGGRLRDDIWAAMAERNLIAYLHAGGERVFKPPFRSSPSEIRTLHRRFPKLKIAAAHLGGFGMWDETEETLVGEDVMLDLSHTFFWMPHERIERIIRNHGARRILFGTDSPWQEQSRILGAFAELPLSESNRRAICCENAMTLFNIKI
jgi:predicted TIM-barrel fold metal-dependent hydrolase